MEEREHPARPEQTKHGFEEGLDHKPDPPEEEQEGRFSKGQERAAHDDEHKERFSEGQERTGDTPEKEREGRFSEGQERT
jgi:hypothetical protein